MADNILYNSNICRLCAENSENGEILFTADSKETELSQMINRYLPLKVHNDGKLPRTICPGCNIQIEATVQFFELLINGQNKIRELWKQQLKNEEKSEKLTANFNPTFIKIINNFDAGPQDKLIELSTNKNGPLYSEEDDITLQVESLSKLKKKKGRPPKSSLTLKEKVKEIDNNEIKPNESIPEDEKLYFDEEDKRKRIRKVPQRFMETVRGKDLDNIFKKEYLFNVNIKEENIDNFDSLDNQNDYEAFNEQLETVAEENSNELQTESKEKKTTEISNQNNDANCQYECEFCDKKFIQRSKYITHKSLHVVQFECEECKKLFSEKENIIQHQQEMGHTGENTITNMLDERNSEDSVILDEDNVIKPIGDSSQNIMKSNLTESNVSSIAEDCQADDLKCLKCNKYFQDKDKLESHIKIVHQGAKPFICEICSKSFAYKASLKGHIDIVHKDSKTDIFPCDECGKIYSDLNSILQHKVSEHSKSNRFTCNKCGKSFKHKQLLQRHQLVHSDDRPYPCTSCNAAFKTKANLLNHQTTHTGEKKHFCELCGQQFAHKTSLTLHYRWHTGQKPYKCDICSKTFSQNGNLQEHLRIHTGEKPYCCDHCGRKFTTSSQFKLHIKRHTGERPWKCEFCSKSFLHKDTWKCHVRRHKGEKPFQCTYCNRGFTEQWALKKHLRLHTGEKPYKCDICNKAFADCSNLTKHKKIHKNKKVLTLPKNTIIQPAGTSEEVPQIIYVAYDNIDDGTAILQFAEDNSEGETIIDEVQEKNDVESSELGNSNFQLHITDENGQTVPVCIENLNQVIDEASLKIQTSPSVTQNTGRRRKFNPNLLKDQKRPSALFQNNFEDATKTIEDDDYDTAIITPENNIHNQILLDDGQQAIEFTTQEGQKVRLVTSINVDPLQLASEYLTIV